MGTLNIVNRNDLDCESTIPAADWANLVAEDPEFVADPKDSECAYWVAWPSRDQTQPPASQDITPRFMFFDGMLSFGFTDPDLTRKGCEVATRLDAFVVGDDEERYNLDGSISVIGDDGNRVPHKKWRWDDPEFWRPPTPEEMGLVPWWRRAWNALLGFLKRKRPMG